MDQELTSADIARLRRVADRDEIRELAYRYAWALDIRDGEAMAALFVADVREKMLRRFDSSMSGVGVTVLFVGNHIVDFDGADMAAGIVYCKGYIETRDGPHPGRFVEQAILYRDTYRREDGAWRFIRRGHELWYGVETAERPLHQRAAEWPMYHDGVGTVPYDIPSWQAFWDRQG